MDKPKEIAETRDGRCCPELSTDPVCDVIDMRRRLVFSTSVVAESGQRIRVEVILHTCFTRCSGPLALGDLVYSTTLLPGENVRLATTDRRSRFSFDSESRLSYRSEQMSEEQYRLSALRAFMSDETVVDRGSDRASERGSWDFHGDASAGIGWFSVSADTNARGSHNAQSAREYLREHRAHAEMSDHQSVEATRKAHSLSIGEVSTRTHQQGESEDHFEASSRVFANPNQCHAVTYLFYRINKTETIRFSIERIERRVIDPAAPTPIAANPIRALGQIASIPQEVPANNSARLEIEARGLQSEAQYARTLGTQPLSAGGFGLAGVAVRAASTALGTQEVLAKDVREKALAEVDQKLVEGGLLDREARQVSREVLEEISYERTTSLPTAGVIVRACLDDCDACEPELHRRQQLELDRLELQNQLLKRQIELLEKSQEYRCCPGAEDGHD